MRRRTATYPRALRVNQVLRQVLADELERLVDADELPMVTVTAVDVAPDMRTAVVYLATLDDETAVVLEERRVHLQRTVGIADDDEAHAPPDLPGRPGDRRGLPGGGVAAWVARGGVPGRRVVQPGRWWRAGGRHRPGGRRQGGRLDLARRGGALPPHLRPAPGRPCRHARPRRHRCPAGRVGPRHPADALPDRAAQDLHDGHRAGQRHVDARLVGRGRRHLRHDQRRRRRGRRRRGRADRRDRAGAADGVGGEGRRDAGCTSWPARASRWSAPPGR